jgi:hypothetical protein
MTAQIAKGQRFTVKSGLSKGQTGTVVNAPMGTAKVPVLMDGGSGYPVYLAQSVIRIEDKS